MCLHLVAKRCIYVLSTSNCYRCMNHIKTPCKSPVWMSHPPMSLELMYLRSSGIIQLQVDCEPNPFEPTVSQVDSAANDVSNEPLFAKTTFLTRRSERTTWKDMGICVGNKYGNIPNPRKSCKTTVFVDCFAKWLDSTHGMCYTMDVYGYLRKCDQTKDKIGSRKMSYKICVMHLCVLNYLATSVYCTLRSTLRVVANWTGVGHNS